MTNNTLQSSNNTAFEPEVSKMCQSYKIRITIKFMTVTKHKRFRFQSTSLVKLDARNRMTDGIKLKFEVKLCKNCDVHNICSI